MSYLMKANVPKKVICFGDIFLNVQKLILPNKLENLHHFKWPQEIYLGA